jgi:hypothetical protein
MMLTKDAFLTWFQKDVLTRWPKCAFTAVQVDDWFRRLKAFDAPTLTEAARRHYTVDEPRRPSLKKLHDYVRQPYARTDTAHEKKSYDVPEAHTYIQCVAKDENGHGPVGRFVPILLWPFHKTYTRQMFDKAAENQRRLHRQNSGGVWEVVTGTTHSRMRRRQWRLTGQTERIEANAARIRDALKAVQT